jgi:hypothetical protein
MREILNAATIWNERRKPSVVQFNKCGHVRFSVEAVKILKLKKTDRISFMIEEDDDLVYFWLDNEQGFPLTESTELKTGVRFSVCCRPLVNRILQHWGKEGNVSVLLSGDKVMDKWFLNKIKIKKQCKRKHLKAKGQ